MEQSGLISLFPLAVLFILFYFLLIKPQQKKVQQQKKMLEEMKVGDMLVLTSGIICEVSAIPLNKDYIVARLDENGSSVRIFKDAIMCKYEENKDEQKTKNKV